MKLLMPLYYVQELLISNMAQNVQLVVRITKEYTEQLGADNIIALFETQKSYDGLYDYLGPYMAFSKDPEVLPTIWWCNVEFNRILVCGWESDVKEISALRLASGGLCAGAVHVLVCYRCFIISSLHCYFSMQYLAYPHEQGRVNVGSVLQSILLCLWVL